LRGKILALAGILMVAVSLLGFTSETGNAILGTIREILLGPEPGETIRIASWNIENFGRAKATDGERMEIIAEVLQGYDIIAVQEISNLREQSDPGCPRNEDACPGNPSCGLVRDALERHLNQSGLNYTLVFSPHVRDERYLFIYNPERVELEEAVLMEDPGDSGPACLDSPETGLMVRQPFMARFRAGEFDFVLLNVHTSPGMNPMELEGLEYFCREAGEEEPDVIILGDLNADCGYLKPDDDIGLRNPEYIWPFGDDVDTTVSGTDCAYDRFIFRGPTSEDFTGRLGMVRGMPPDVSDHYLIWAEFYTERDSA
jgi:deoxyribonuclease-1-like protein